MIHAPFPFQGVNMQANHVSKLYLYIATFVLGSSMLLGIISAIQTQNIQIFINTSLLAGPLFSVPWLIAHWRYKKRLAKVKQLKLFEERDEPIQLDYRCLKVAVIAAAIPTIFFLISAMVVGDIFIMIGAVLFGSFVAFPFIVFFQNSRFESIESSAVNNSGWVDYSSNHHTARRGFKSQASFDQTFSPAYRSFSQNIYHNRR